MIETVGLTVQKFESTGRSLWAWLGAGTHQTLAKLLVLLSLDFQKPGDPERRSPSTKPAGFPENQKTPCLGKGENVNAWNFLTYCATHDVSGQEPLRPLQKLKFHGFTLVEGSVPIFLDS